MERKCHAIASLCVHDATFSVVLWNLVSRYVQLKGSKGRYVKVSLLMSCSIFQENTTGIVEMLDDPPEAVKALVDFIYGARYDVDHDQDVILSHLDVFIIGQKYGLRELRDTAREKITDLLEQDVDAAIEAFPDIAGAVEQLEIDNGRSWTIKPGEGDYKYDDWLKWADENADLFMEDDDIWDAMVEKAPKLMEVLAQRFFDDWERRADEWGMDFVQRLDGPETSGEFQKCTVRCPRRECGHIQDRFFLTEAPMIVACNDCQSKYETRMWMEYVQNPADEVNE